MKSILQKKKIRLLISLLYIVIGILLCCSVIQLNDLPTWIISIFLICASAVLLIFSIVSYSRLISLSGTIGLVTLACGIFLLPPLPCSPLIDWTILISLVLMTLAVGLFLDSVIGFFTDRNNVFCFLFLLLSGFIFSLGICLWIYSLFRKYAGIVIGVFLIMYGIYKIILMLTKKDADGEVKANEEIEL